MSLVQPIGGRKQQTVSNFVTVSDEAFVLLVIENCEAKWKDMFDKNVTTSTMPNKYTDGGTCIKSGRSRTYRGWSNAGLHRFNYLFNLVKKDRMRTDNGFEGNFLSRMQTNRSNNNKRKVRVVVNYPPEDNICLKVEDDMDIVAV
jgi:hypothetical protein